MKKIVLPVVALFIFLACSKTATKNIALNGHYAGFFTRSGMDTSSVIFLFTGNSYEGNSENVHYPAICRGSFAVQNNTVTFADSCAWRADFDWTLILNDTYNIQAIPEQKIRIWRSTDGITDEYILNKSAP